MIDRSPTRDTPANPMALYEVAKLFGTRVAEAILASAHVRAHQQAVHMGASDLTKSLQKYLARRGPSTYGLESGEEGGSKGRAIQRVPGFRIQTRDGSRGLDIA